MPRYDYECNSCQHKFELKQSFDSEPSADCPVCGHKSRRKFSAVSIVFKGSGFYVNDYGKGGASASEKSSDKKSESRSDADGSSKSKSDSSSKPEAKKETTASKKTER